MRQLVLTLCALVLATSHSVAQAKWEKLGQSDKHRVEANGIVHDGGLFVFNGFSFKIDIETQIERYDFDDDRWQNVVKTTPNGANATAVTHAGVVKVGNEFWLIGGRVGDHPGRVTDRVQIFNLDTYKWRQGPRLPTPFASGGAAVVNGMLHVFGGLDKNARCDVGNHYVYNLKQSGKGWQKLSVSMPDKRNHFATTVNNGLIYAIGGQYGHDGQCPGAKKSRTQSTSVHAFNPKTGKWQARATLPSTVSHTEPSTFSHAGIIYSVGGLGKGNQVLTYDPSKNKWQVRKDLQLPTRLLAPVSVINGNYLYVVGGGAPSATQPTNTVYRMALNLVADDDPEPVDNGSGGDSNDDGNTAGNDNDDNNGSTGNGSSGNGSSGNGGNEADTAADDAAYRINVGGSLLIDDAGRRWEADKSATRYVTTPSRTYSRAGAVTVNANRFDGPVPGKLFETERFGRTARGLAWEFPVKPGDYTVSLYFAEIFPGAFSAGKRVFDIEIEGDVRASNVDIADEVGPRSGTVKTFRVTSDKTLDVLLKGRQQNPMLKGIAITPYSGNDNDDTQAGNDGNGNGYGNGNGNNQNAGSDGGSASDNGNPAKAELHYSSIDVVIADTLAGNSGSATITIDNVGNQDATLTELSFSGSNASLFDASLLAGTDIEAGDSVELTISFRPVRAGSFSTMLAIADDSPDKLTLISIEARAQVLNDGISQGTLLPVFRINVGGNDIPSADGIDWQGDLNLKKPGYDRSKSRVYSTGAKISTTRPDIPAYAPAELFSTERWAPGSTQALTWTFPVEPGQHEIRLYFAEIFARVKKPGTRVFDVVVDGQLKIDDLDVFAEAGSRNAYMRSIVVDTDDDLSVSLEHVKQNPAIKAIEIRRCLVDCR